MNDVNGGDDVGTILGRRGACRKLVSTVKCLWVGRNERRRVDGTVTHVRLQRAVSAVGWGYIGRVKGTRHDGETTTIGEICRPEIRLVKEFKEFCWRRGRRRAGNVGRNESHLGHQERVVMAECIMRRVELR